MSTCPHHGGPVLTGRDQARAASTDAETVSSSSFQAFSNFSTPSRSSTANTSARSTPASATRSSASPEASMHRTPLAPWAALAFDGSLNWDIKRIQGAGFMAGGLFNLFLQGQGMVAVTSDGPPMLLDCSQQPTFVDPQAAVCWSANLQPQIKNDFKMGSLIGRGSGESFQLGFHGPGFVVVQPSEGVPVITTGS